MQIGEKEESSPAAKLIVHGAFVEADLDITKQRARQVHEWYFEVRDRESRPAFIAPKTCAIAMNSLLTAGGKEHRSGARMNVNPQQLMPRSQQLRVPPCRQNPARSVARMGSDAAAVDRVPVGHVITDAWPPAPAGTMHRSIGHRRH